MLDEPELKELLNALQKQYKAITIEIINKCEDKEDYSEEFIAQNKIYAQIELLHHILDSKSKASLAEKAEHN